jgi:hypothetical protein
MIIRVPVVESNTDIEFVIAKIPAEIIINRNDVEIPLIKLQVLFKGSVFQKDGVKFSMIFQANTMVDQYPATSCVFEGFFVKPQ